MNHPEHRQAVLQNIQNIVADWKSGQWSIRQLATREHRGQDAIRAILHASIPNEEYERFRAKHERDTRNKNMRPFAKGNKPWITGRHIRTRDNALPIGTVRVWRHKLRQCTRNGGPRYLYRRFIKVSNDPVDRRHNWTPYCQYLWEKEHGPVPEGHFVIHKDGKTMNDKSENLELSTLADSGRRATATTNIKTRTRKQWEKRWLPRRIAAAREQKMEEIATQWDDAWCEEEAA